MGSKISKLCKDFSLKSNCVSNCCSNGSKNDVIIEEPKHHKNKKHKHKHKDDINKNNINENEIVG